MTASVYASMQPMMARQQYTLLQWVVMVLAILGL